MDTYRVSRTPDSEFCFAWCTRPHRGLRAGPAPPHRNRAYGHGHETSPQRGRWSPVRYLGRRRPTADCRKRKWHSEHGNAAVVVGSDRTLTLNVERQVGR